MFLANKVSSRPLENTYNLDLFAWATIRSIAQSNPHYLREQMGMPEATLELLASCTEDKLRAIPSGVICSFRLVAEEHQIIRHLLTTSRILKESPSALVTVDTRISTAVSDLLCDYLRYIRDCVREEGLAIARVRYDQPENVLRALEGATDLQIRITSRAVPARFEVRFSYDCLNEILSRDHITHFKVLQLQQAIANLKTAFVPMQDGQNKASLQRALDNLAENGKDECEDSGDAQAIGCAPTLRGHDPEWLLATYLGKMGFNGDAIKNEAPISAAQLSRLRNELLEQNVDITNISKRPRTGRFIVSYQTSLHASIMMQLYSTLAGADYAYRLDLNALVAALSMYKAIRIETHSNNVHRWPEITAVEAYVLAKECRGDGIQVQAYMDDCPDCHSKHFVSIHQSVADADRCPYCRIKDATRLNAA